MRQPLGQWLLVCLLAAFCFAVPAAMLSFLESSDFEDAVRNAVSLGGGSDTLACIAGSVAQAHYGVPSFIEQEALRRLDPELRSITR